MENNGIHCDKMSDIERMIKESKAYKLVSREFHHQDTIIKVGNVEIGGRNIVMIAGPCSVENEIQVLETARAVKKSGAHILRGGAYKPRTSVYSFQGLGEDSEVHGVEVRVIHESPDARVRLVGSITVRVPVELGIPPFGRHITDATPAFEDVLPVRGSVQAVREAGSHTHYGDVSRAYLRGLDDGARGRCVLVSSEQFLHNRSQRAGLFQPPQRADGRMVAPVPHAARGIIIQVVLPLAAREQIMAAGRPRESRELVGRDRLACVLVERRL